MNSRNNVPNVDGAYTPPNSVFIPPERTTSRSSMLSAPAHIPAIIVASFGAGLAAPDLIRGSAIWTFSAEQLGQAGLLGQGHHRHQPGTRHQMVIVEHRRLRGEAMRHLHRKCLSELDQIVA